MRKQEEMFMQRPSFVPKILLCGDEEEFLSRIGNRPFELVGRVKIKDDKIFLGDKLQNLPALINLLQSGAADYFVFNKPKECRSFINAARQKDFRSPKIVTLDEFKSFPSEFFYDAESEVMLIRQLKDKAIKTLLDVDAYFAQGKLFTKLENDFTDIECVSDKPLLPIKENICTRTYKNLAAVGFKRYDAALIIERKPADFDEIFNHLKDFSETVITFARTASELENHLTTKKFEKASTLQTSTGAWHFLTRLTPPEDFCNYVVTHKLTPHDGKLPDAYKVIHAGREGKKELGYCGDDTGDNISRLNPYLNEVTALYWIWKNTAHTTLGFCQYRRFFTTADDKNFSYDKILTRNAALKILTQYDIIVAKIYIGRLQRELIRADCGKTLMTLGETIIKKYLKQAQPDYLDAFDYVLNSKSFYRCNMFVTRRNIFDAYCKWLFSFMIDATKEFLQTTNLDDIPPKRRRVMGYFAERMLTVWLLRNRLRIKELNVMFIEDI